MIPLVLVPGFMCDARLFAPQIAVLANDRDVLPVVPVADTLAGMADEVLAAAPRRFALGGLSMGGIVALEIIARAPERVARLALMDTTPLADAPANHSVRTRQIADVQAGHLDTVMRDELKPAYLVESPAKPAILDLCLDMARGLGPEVFRTQSLALRDRPSHEATLARIDQPTLILCGRQDRLCPVARHQEMHAAIPHSHLEIIDDAGHLPTLEQPERTTAALARWLED